MKYDVKFSCGHTEEIQLFGKTADRERKIAYYEQYGLCSCCYAAKKDAGKATDCVETEMFYGEYKRNYASCATKTGSYDAKKKTIVVYVPKQIA